MNIEIKQISSLEKVRNVCDIPQNELNKAQVLKGESYSYQVVIIPNSHINASVKIESPLSEYIRLYEVKNAVMDFSVYKEAEMCKEDFITLEEGLIPDILNPIETQNERIHIRENVGTLWVEVKIPEELKTGDYPVKIKISGRKVDSEEYFEAESIMNITVLKDKLSDTELIYTQWFYADCIATAHNVEIYSEKHWELIDSYMKTAVEIGVNMMLVPVISPPLDTAVGKTRPNTQLVKIEKCNNEYIFDFSRLCRWISICKKNGIKYYEISHLFTQWGACFAPNIWVWENGEERHMFGWHTKADSEEYVGFLKVFLPALIEILKEEEIAESCYFHISDEPAEKQLGTYTVAHDILLPLIKDFKNLDAISNFQFYKKGLIPTPVCATDAIMPFIENNAEHLWAYYCCGQWNGVGNRFLSMPSYRNRILGLQLYKYNIEGFLHWGYNFYYSQFSEYEINPYATTSADRAFPSGDAFSVYPGKNGPLKSLRAVVFNEALQDIAICRQLEKKIGREAVIKMIDDAAGMDITFEKYPKNAEFIINLIDNMKSLFEK